MSVFFSGYHSVPPLPQYSNFWNKSTKRKLATQSTVVFCFVWFRATLILNFLLNLGRNNCLKKVILCKNITLFLNNCISKKHQLCVLYHAFRHLFFAVLYTSRQMFWWRAWFLNLVPRSLVEDLSSIKKIQFFCLARLWANDASVVFCACYGVCNSFFAKFSVLVESIQIKIFTEEVVSVSI